MMMRRPVLASYLLGVLMLAALIAFVAQMGEIERFFVLARQVEPGWLALGLLLQSATYLFEAAAWKLLLDRLGHPFGIRQLLPLSVAKMFSDQAVPSAGLSGNAFFLNAVPLALWRVRRRRDAPDAALLFRHPRLRVRTDTLHRAAARLPPQPAWFLEMSALHAGIMILDALTLWAMLRALGLDPAFDRVFSSFVLASAVMSVSPVPLGLGTFEGSCVALLHGAGVELEAGLTATLLLRGTTTWLPMLPGLWMIRREMRGARRATRCPQQ